MRGLNAVDGSFGGEQPHRRLFHVKCDRHPQRYLDCIDTLEEPPGRESRS